jgi:hypothetical protein
MAIGYIGNLGVLQQGNQQVVNSMAGLGQSISNAIETHAATQSAQAMLPMLQQQYQAGMQKLSTGDQSGIGDVIQAAGLAGQNPLTAQIGRNMVVGMTQLNEFTRARQLANARLGGALIAAQARGYAANLAHPTDAQGNPIPKGETANETAMRTSVYRQRAMDLWNGKGNLTGAGQYAEDYIKSGENSKNFADMLNQYIQLKKDRPGFVDPNFENVILAKQAYDRGVSQGNPKNQVEESVLNAWKSIKPGSQPIPATPTAPMGSPAAAPSAPVQIPAGLQISPMFNTGGSAPTGMIPAASGMGGVVQQAPVDDGTQEEGEQATTPEEAESERSLIS